MNAPAPDHHCRRCREPPRWQKAVSWLAESCCPNRHPVVPGLVGGLSPRKRIGTSGLDAGRTEPGFLPSSLTRKRRHNHEVRPRNAGKDQLRDTVPGPDLDAVAALRRIAVPRRNEAGSLVIGVDQTDRVAEN